jgi:hypothetical protein
MLHHGVFTPQVIHRILHIYPAKRFKQHLRAILLPILLHRRNQTLNSVLLRFHIHLEPARLDGGAGHGGSVFVRLVFEAEQLQQV